MLRTTHTSTVTEDQIDHLGHMNVRYYAENARTASRNLVAALPGWESEGHELFDVYTRHHREQLQGAPLEVSSGVLSVDEHELVLHHELANSASAELAATFIHRLRPIGEDGTATTLGEKAITAAAEMSIETPAHAAPRTIRPDHDLEASAPGLGVLRERGLATHRPSTISADLHDRDGRWSIDVLPELFWGGEPIDPEAPNLYQSDWDGRTLAWASMESRVRIVRPARAGMRVQAFGATIAVHDKVDHNLRWAHDLDTGDLLVIFETVSLVFDIGARRPASIPEPVRAHLLSRLSPDLAPAPN